MEKSGFRSAERCLRSRSRQIPASAINIPAEDTIFISTSDRLLAQREAVKLRRPEAAVAFQFADIAVHALLQRREKRLDHGFLALDFELHPAVRQITRCNQANSPIVLPAASM